MFKHGLDQLVYYLKDNRIHSAKVLSRVIVENNKEDSAHTEKQIEFYKRFGGSRIQYSTCHGEFNECQVFKSKEELIHSI